MSEAKREKERVSECVRKREGDIEREGERERETFF